jgi:2-oxoglutarate ferredoxin oxidoreductase subunit delta
MSIEQAPASSPEAPAEVKTTTRSRRRGHVTVFGKWCKGCGLCIAFCPQQVFEVDADGHPIVAHEEKCTACNWCYYHCPDCAIVVDLVGDSKEKAGPAQ